MCWFGRHRVVPAPKVMPTSFFACATVTLEVSEIQRTDDIDDIGPQFKRSDQTRKDVTLVTTCKLISYLAAYALLTGEGAQEVAEFASSSGADSRIPVAFEWFVLIVD